MAGPPFPAPRSGRRSQPRAAPTFTTPPRRPAPPVRAAGMNGGKAARGRGPRHRLHSQKRARAGPPSSLRFCEWGKAAGGAALRGAALRAGGGPGLRGGHPLRPPPPLSTHTHLGGSPPRGSHTHTRTHQPQDTRSCSCSFSLCPLARVALGHDSRFPPSAPLPPPHCPPLLPRQKGTVKRQPAGKHSGEGSLLPFTLRGGGAILGEKKQISSPEGTSQAPRSHFARNTPLRLPTPPSSAAKPDFEPWPGRCLKGIRYRATAVRPGGHLEMPMC